MSFTRIADIPLQEPFGPGHRLCAGCGAGIAVRLALKAARGPTVAVNATCCVEVSTTPYPYNAWGIPWVHVLFENTAAVASGIVEALDKLAREGRGQKADVIAFAGDGGTFDIGLQALSGALERGHDFLFICYDNEAYMNTGIQRSSATPVGAHTTTSPAAGEALGKLERKKDIIGIVASHGVEYAATAAIWLWRDYMNKVRKAIEVNGPAFIHVHAPCQLGWGFPESETVGISRLAAETRFFPVYEVDKGAYRITYRPSRPRPVVDYLKAQARFRHLFQPKNEHVLEWIQRIADENWARLERLEAIGKQPS